LTFRIYIGKYDGDNEFYTYQCNGDSIVVNKIMKNDNDPKDPYKKANKIISKQAFDLSTLKKEHPLKK
jgi:hypothetical protein